MPVIGAPTWSPVAPPGMALCKNPPNPGEGVTGKFRVGALGIVRPLSTERRDPADWPRPPPLPINPLTAPPGPPVRKPPAARRSLLWTNPRSSFGFVITGSIGGLTEIEVIGGGATTSGFKTGKGLLSRSIGGLVDIFLTVGTIVGLGLLSLKTGLRLFGTPIPLGKFFKLALEPALKLFDLRLNAPDPLNKLL